MKIGFWNRAAIVLGVIGIVAVPTWWAVTINLNHSRVMESGYRTCVAAADERRDIAGSRYCYELWVTGQSSVGWGDWLQAVAWAIPAMLIIYGLLFSVVWVAKWVWRGRAGPG